MGAIKDIVIDRRKILNNYALFKQRAKDNGHTIITDYYIVLSGVEALGFRQLSGIIYHIYTKAKADPLKYAEYVLTMAYRYKELEAEGAGVISDMYYYGIRHANKWAKKHLNAADYIRYTNITEIA